MKGEWNQKHADTLTTLSVRYFFHFIKDIKQVGAVLPSSRYLARNVVDILKQRPGSEPLNVLEIGAGTGTFTGYIQQQLGSEDHMDVIELNDTLFNILQNRHQAPNIALHHLDFLDFEVPYKYDYIFSSIPYEGIEPAISKQLWQRKLAYCKDGAYITYYKYWNFNRFRSDYEKQLVYRCRADKKTVFMNVPPANLFTLRIDQPGELLPEDGMASQQAQ